MTCDGGGDAAADVDAHRGVTGIALPRNALRGALTAEFYDALGVGLRVWDMGWNDLGGALSAADIGRMTRLEVMAL